MQQQFRSCARALCLLGILLAGASEAQSDPTPASIRGRVSLGLPGTKLPDLGPIVVFLDAVEGELDRSAPRETVLVKQENARFSPSFRVVVKGQTVEMPNGDAIYHNVFSYSAPNDFDLGTYPAGESRSVTLAHAGVVKVYCSIHESMNATIFVAPSTHYALVRSGGSFSIPQIEPGRYRLRAWSEKLPLTSRLIKLSPGMDLDVELDLAKTDF